MSFLVIVNLWTSHHYLLFTLRQPARTTLWYNSLLLFSVTLIPVATRFLGMHPTSPRAAASYGFVAALCTAAFMLLRSHAARTTRNDVHRGIHRRVILPRVARRMARTGRRGGLSIRRWVSGARIGTGRVIRRTWLFLTIYLASIPLAFVNLWLAWACFVIVPPMLFLPVIRVPVMGEEAPHDHALERSCP